MTTSDWPVSRVVKKNQTVDPMLLFYLLQNCHWRINSATKSDGVMQWCRLQSLTLLRRSFKTCGISNALDGSEDDAIYDNKMPRVADNDKEDKFETDSKEDDDD